MFQTIKYICITILKTKQENIRRLDLTDKIINYLLFIYYILDIKLSCYNLLVTFHFQNLFI